MKLAGLYSPVMISVFRNGSRQDSPEKQHVQTNRKRACTFMHLDHRPVECGVYRLTVKQSGQLNRDIWKTCSHCIQKLKQDDSWPKTWNDKKLRGSIYGLLLWKRVLKYATKCLILLKNSFRPTRILSEGFCWGNEADPLSCSQPFVSLSFAIPGMACVGSSSYWPDFYWSLEVPYIV